jgi:hypothetical protein
MVSTISLIGIFIDPPVTAHPGLLVYPPECPLNWSVDDRVYRHDQSDHGILSDSLERTDFALLSGVGLGDGLKEVTGYPGTVDLACTKENSRMVRGKTLGAFPRFALGLTANIISMVKRLQDDVHLALRE